LNDAFKNGDKPKFGCGGICSEVEAAFFSLHNERVCEKLPFFYVLDVALRVQRQYILKLLQVGEHKNDVVADVAFYEALLDALNDI